MTAANIAHYLSEFKKRLLYYCTSLAILFLILFYFSKPLYSLLAHPLLKQFTPNSTLIATEIAAPLITPLKLAWLCALLLSLPLGCYQVWAFIAPALYQHERRRLWPFMIASILFCYLGLLFAYYIVLPLLLQFFMQQLPTSVIFMPDMSHYLDFCTQILFSFGLSFEIPLVIILLVYLGITTKKQLRQLRPYMIVTSFIIGMLLTPPDVLSQCMLALPMCLLFEIGLFFAPISVAQRIDSTTNI